MSSPLWKCSIAVAGLLIAMSVTAEAQVCGDADGNGVVTVTDGVQVLRQAAGLSSSCGTTLCDVDGNGTVTVTDGVNVLRKAAGLPITESCSVGRNDQLQSLVRSSLLIFGALTKTGGASARIAQEQPCDNDGTLEVFEDSVDFTDCQLGDVIFDGTIGFPGPDAIEFGALDIIDPVTDDTLLTVDGTLSVRSVQGNLVLSGPLDVSTGDLDPLSITFVDVVIDADGFIVDGALDLDVTDTGIEGVVGIRLGLADSRLLPVTVTFDDNTTLQFTFDTVSGELTEG